MIIETLTIGVVRFIILVLFIIISCLGTICIMGSFCELFESRNYEHRRYKNVILLLIVGCIMLLPFIYVLGEL
jgi:hypothetical protein